MESVSSSGAKCMNPGPITKNGYLNFLREYRQKHCGLSPRETVRQGAAEWNKLSEEEKNKFTQMGCMIGNGPGGNGGNGGKCMKAGPITRNGYLNYLRDFRRNHCGLSVVETVRQGAKEWNNLSEAEKNKYTQMGCSIGRRRTRSRSRSGSRSRRSASAPRRSSRSRSHVRSKRRASEPRLHKSKSLSRSRSRRSSKKSPTSRRSMVCHRMANHTSAPRRSSSSQSHVRSRRRASEPRRRKSKLRSRSRSRRSSKKSPTSRRSMVCHRM